MSAIDAMIPLAQTIPGTEIGPLMLACSVAGWIAGLVGVILSMTRASKQLVLAMALLAVASALFVLLVFFVVHGLSFESATSVLARHWVVMTSVHAMPLVLGAAAVALLYGRGGKQ